MVIVEELQTSYNSMEAEIDSLENMFASSSITVKNTTQFALYVKSQVLYSNQVIHENVMVGELQGVLAYIWEVHNNSFILIDNEMVLDVRKHMNNILSYIREENQSYQASNCYIQMMTQKDGSIKFFLITKKMVFPHEEIVYSTFDFAHVELP